MTPKLCACGCGKEIEPGRPPTVKYRLECARPNRMARQNDSVGYAPSWRMHELAVKAYPYSKEDE